MTSVFLLGFMACGKTTVGRELAGRCGLPLFDLDETIAESVGRTPAAIISEKGEDVFREIESRVLRSCPDPAVIAGGGGSFLSPENRAFLKRKGTRTVFLDLPWRSLAERIEAQEGQERPLWESDENARALFETRLPIYRQAEIHLELNGDEAPGEVVDLLLQRLPELKCGT